MAKDLTVVLEDRPGRLADLGDALGKAGVNIDGLSGVAGEGKALMHVLVEDAAGARKALEGAGFHIQGERDVALLDIQDRPGELGKLCRKIANAGVNINLAYLASKTRLVIGADNLDKVRAAAK
jgi:hypothetical protein